MRLADELVAFIDQQVAAGDAPSRAAAVADPVAWARRREMSERDAAILAVNHGAADDFDGLADFAAQTLLDDLA